MKKNRGGGHLNLAGSKLHLFPTRKVAAKYQALGSGARLLGPSPRKGSPKPTEVNMGLVLLIFLILLLFGFGGGGIYYRDQRNGLWLVAFILLILILFGYFGGWYGPTIVYHR